MADIGRTKSTPLGLFPAQIVTYANEAVPAALATAATVTTDPTVHPFGAESVMWAELKRRWKTVKISPLSTKPGRIYEVGYLPSSAYINCVFDLTNVDFNLRDLVQASLVLLNLLK